MASRTRGFCLNGLQWCSMLWLLKVVFLVCLLETTDLVNLLSVGASLCKACLTAGWLAEHDIAVPAKDDCLRVAEDGRDLEASWALDIHEEGIWRLHKSLQLVSADFGIWGWMKEIDWHDGRVGLLLAE